MWPWSPAWIASAETFGVGRTRYEGACTGSHQSGALVSLSSAFHGGPLKDSLSVAHAPRARAHTFLSFPTRVSPISMWETERIRPIEMLESLLGAGRGGAVRPAVARIYVRGCYKEAADMLAIGGRLTLCATRGCALAPHSRCPLLRTAPS